MIERWPLRREQRVAGLYCAGFVARGEPLLALLRGAVGPGLLVHLARRLLLKPVVAYCLGGIEALGDVGVRHGFDVAGLDRVVSPDAGEAVRLQLRAHAGAVGRLAGVADVRHDATQILDMMSVLVRKDVALGEGTALGAEARV